MVCVLESLGFALSVLQLGACDYATRLNTRGSMVVFGGRVARCPVLLELLPFLSRVNNLRHPFPSHFFPGREGFLQSSGKFAECTRGGFDLPIGGIVSDQVSEPLSGNLVFRHQSAGFLLGGGPAYGLSLRAGTWLFAGIPRLRPLRGQPPFGEFLPAVAVPLGLWQNRFTVPIRLGGCYFPEFGLLFLPYVFEINALVSSELGVDCSPFLVYGLELVVFELYPFTINLPGIEVEMYVGVLRVAMDRTECNRLWECLLEEPVRQVPDLFIASWDIKRQNYAVVSPPSLPSLIVFQRAEIVLDVQYFFLERELVPAVPSNTPGL